MTAVYHWAVYCCDCSCHNPCSALPSGLVHTPFCKQTVLAGLVAVDAFLCIAVSAPPPPPHAQHTDQASFVRKGGRVLSPHPPTHPPTHPKRFLNQTLTQEKSNLDKRPVARAPPPPPPDPPTASKLK